MSVKLLEKDIQRQVLDYLKLKKIFCWKNNTAGIYRKSTDSYIPSHAKGVSDIMGIMPDGKFLAIEVKRPGGKLSPDQEAFLQNVKDNNGVAMVVYSIDDLIKQMG